MSVSRESKPPSHLLYLQAMRVLKEHQAGRKIDKEGLAWAKYNAVLHAPAKRQAEAKE